MLTLEDLAEVVRPLNARILAEHRADALEAQLKAANTIIAETNTVLASVHAALCEVLDFILESPAVNEEAANRILQSLAKIEGRK